MPCGSSGTSAVSGSPPAALCAVRVAGPGSAPAGSAAHDSSGRRWFPNTPAPAICVVLVIIDADGAPLPPDDPEVQPPHTAAEIAAAAAAASAGRTPLTSTGPTLTSGQLKPTLPAPTAAGKSVHRVITTVCRTCPSRRPLER